MKNVNIRCDEKMTTHPEFTCGNAATFAAVYTTPDDQSAVRYGCTAHMGKVLKYASKHNHPVRDGIGIVDLNES